MYFLGISGGLMIGNQDGGAALMKDGKLIAAVEEERLLGDKHASGNLPRRAIAYCLKEAGITIQDVESVSFPGKTYRDFDAILKDYLEFHFGHAPKIELVDHHTAHAATTYFAWDRDPALILTMDFSGDRACTTASVGEGNEIREVLRMGKPNSLGVYYSVLTQYLCFMKDSDEYKVMDLSPYGEPTIDMNGLLCKDGETYRLNSEFLKIHVAPDLPAPSKQERLYIGDLGLPGKARLASEPLTDYHRDVAASGQKQLEDMVLHLIEGLVKQTGLRRLCLAGGVSLNCVMNQKIRESGLVDELYVLPHVSDAGLSIGGAMLQSAAHGVRPEPMQHCYIGPSFSDDEIDDVISNCHIKAEKLENVAEQATADLAVGSVVGWFQGRMEFGPRSLGNASILADPRKAEMKDRINLLVKFREGFRPFTPSVAEEAAGEFFKDIKISPYMTQTYDVQPDKRAVIPAVTHVDGSARVQTVSRKYNPRYHALISEFGRLTGVPVVLNTSLNLMGQPIAAHPRAALANFYSTGMDRMALGSWYLSK